MEWLSTENLVAILTALLGIAASFAVVWYERRVPRRRRIGYRVQMDMPVGGDDRSGQGQADIRLGLFNDLPDMADATLVLLRIENDGAESVADTDYTSRDLHGLTAVFAGRVVRGVAVTVTQPDAEHLMEHFTASRGMRNSGNTIYLPRVPLNRGQHYKLLVLLTGGRVGSAVRVSGGIRDGAVAPNRSTTVDDKPPLFSQPSRLITVLLTVCVTVLASIIVVGDGTPQPIGCAAGNLTVNGSTAFAPVMREVAARYEADCAGGTVTVDTRGSNEGLTKLAAAGSPAQGAPEMITIYDGAGPQANAELLSTRVGVSAFAVVVNNDLPVKNLTTDQVRRIFRGDFLNWSQLDGPDLPISLVSRDADSGTRDLFRRVVLGAEGEPAFTSYDCARQIYPQDEGKVIRCERRSTGEVLAGVASLPGAIGYSELRAALAVPGLHTVSLDGHSPSIESLGKMSYPFAAVEFAYTYGPPRAGSLTASFLTYLTRDIGQSVMREQGHLPCYTPEGFRRCEDRP
ncbi:ABC-type phosphate transport system, substrate-binding protein [Parafrankia irregularis]|uniref:ABC-type phosphate transport system, substrate-binding protein n=1 Tax=Parafrankia irregularis TaxID=795642 RepID=A0A0S4QHZ8_9ACTN|nr:MULTISPECIES: substrate-binding domain-containing protein [Parafrankia]MBE3203218.1 substrate-binding domain-containing protein [Parafrankia sp. CH37]CUU54138.1 ABC-type phosphate transport system, substrate-binding protein [Parafrankia irregularis]